MLLSVIVCRSGPFSLLLFISEHIYWSLILRCGPLRLQCFY